MINAMIRGLKRSSPEISYPLSTFDRSGNEGRPYTGQFKGETVPRGPNASWSNVIVASPLLSILLSISASSFLHLTDWYCQSWLQCINEMNLGLECLIDTRALRSSLHSCQRLFQSQMCEESNLTRHNAYNSLLAVADG